MQKPTRWALSITPTFLSGLRWAGSSCCASLASNINRWKPPTTATSPVVEASCRYKSPARYDDELILETTILALRRSVIKFGYRLLRRESEGEKVTLLAEGETTHVTVNRSLHKVALPSKYAEALAHYLAPPSAV